MDPTRLTMRVMSFSRGSADAYGNNGYYPGKRAQPVFFSEHWTDANPRPGVFFSKPDPDRHYSMGTAYWPAFDYGTHHDFKMHYTGAIDSARLPKRQWHWHRAAWLGIDPPAWPADGTPAKLSITSEKQVIGTNGQDDTQLIVRVHDADGVHINSKLNVTFDVVSGPGRFPTGDTLELETADGVTGISLRSYEAGTTVVEVRAEGLEPAQVELTFVEGGIQEQPQPEAWPTTAGLPDLPNLALNRPANASTQQRENPAKAATDGSGSTRWCATGAEPNQWWSVDLGALRKIAGVGVVFESHADYQFVVEVSRNGRDWTIASDQTDSGKLTKERAVMFEAPAAGRYVRIRYVGLPGGAWASHYDVAVYGADG